MQKLKKKINYSILIKKTNKKKKKNKTRSRLNSQTLFFSEEHLTNKTFSLSILKLSFSSLSMDGKSL